MISCLGLPNVDVKGPKKIFPELPFGNMDSDKVEARKSLLETFLRVRSLNFFYFNINDVNLTIFK